MTQRHWCTCLSDRSSSHSQRASLLIATWVSQHSKQRSRNASGQMCETPMTRCTEVEELSFEACRNSAHRVSFFVHVSVTRHRHGLVLVIVTYPFDSLRLPSSMHSSDAEPTCKQAAFKSCCPIDPAPPKGSVVAAFDLATVAGSVDFPPMALARFCFFSIWIAHRNMDAINPILFLLRLRRNT